VSLESLKSLVSNEKFFMGFGSAVGKIWAEQAKWPELEVKILSK